MQQYGATDFTKLSFLSLSIALVAGPSGLPHVLMRFYTVPTAKEARRSAVWAIGWSARSSCSPWCSAMGAAKLVGPQAIVAAPGKANAAAPLLALSSAERSSWRHLRRRVRHHPGGRRRPDDHRVGLVRPRHLQLGHQGRQGRPEPGGQGRPHHVGGHRRPRHRRRHRANGQNIAFLISLAFAVAASANLPSILYTLYWKPVQHARRRLVDLRGPDQLRAADRLLERSPATKTAMLGRRSTSPGSR
jgi:cation/acetate symporter